MIMSDEHIREKRFGFLSRVFERVCDPGDPYTIEDYMQIYQRMARSTAFDELPETHEAALKFIKMCEHLETGAQFRAQLRSFNARVSQACAVQAMIEPPRNMWN